MFTMTPTYASPATRSSRAIAFSVKLCAALFILSIGTVTAHAQISIPVTGAADPNFQHITRFMQDYLEATGTTAATLEIRNKNGGTLLRQGYGWLDAAATQTTPPTAMLRLSSITKSFTHLAINQLVAAGAISIEAKAFCLNGETPSGTGCLFSADPAGGDGIHDPRAEDITLRHLVDHSAGWDETTTDENGVTNMNDSVRIAELLSVPNPPTNHEMVNYQLDQPLEYDPGTQSHYLAFGYMALAEIIEHFSGLPYMEYIYRNITDPQGIPRSDVDFAQELVENRNQREPNYVSTDGMLVQNLFDPAGPYVLLPDGGIMFAHAFGATGLLTTTGALLDYMRGYWLFDPAPRNPEDGWEYIRGGAADGSLSLAVQNSPLPGYASQADWVILLNKWLDTNLHEQLRTLIRNSLTQGIAIGDNEGEANTEQFFTMYVPVGYTGVEFKTDGGDGDLDLYVKLGAKPTSNDYDCKSVKVGSSQYCHLPIPRSGLYYVMLRGNTPYSGVSVSGNNSYTPNINCSANYKIVSDWGSGFQVGVTVTNRGAADIRGYKLIWTLGPGESFVSGWNANYLASGRLITAYNNSDDWNGVIKANSGKATFWFNAANTAAPADLIRNFSLNGVSCATN